MAQYFVVRIGGGGEGALQAGSLAAAVADRYAAPTLAQAIDAACPDPADLIEVGKVEASDAQAARLMAPRRWARTPYAQIARFIR